MFDVGGGRDALLNPAEIKDHSFRAEKKFHVSAIFTESKKLVGMLDPRIDN